jgi:hypothetical protein
MLGVLLLLFLARGGGAGDLGILSNIETTHPCKDEKRVVSWCLDFFFCFFWFYYYHSTPLQ